MFFLFGQDYRNRQVENSSRWTGGKGQNYRWNRKHHAYAAYDYDWDGEADYEYFPDEVYHLADEEAPDYDWEKKFDYTTRCLKINHLGLKMKLNLPSRPMKKAMRTKTMMKPTPPTLTLVGVSLTFVQPEGTGLW